jgi:hypothetical protein
MGAEFEAEDSISQLANVHFPEMEAFDAHMGGVEGTNLDFMNLGEGGEWGMGKKWNGNMGAGSDLDGFPPSNPFTAGVGFGNADKFRV